MGADSDLIVDFIKIIKIRNSDLYLGIKKKGGGEFYSNSMVRKIAVHSSGLCSFFSKISLFS